MRRKENNRDDFLDRLFATYRSLVGDFEPSPAFIAMVWQRIEARREEQGGWASYLVAWTPRLLYGSLALALILIASQWLPINDRREDALMESSYVDVLTENSLDEQDSALWALAEYRR